VTSTEQLMEVARQAAELAAAVLREAFTRPRTVHHKGAIDLVTDADLASERVLVEFFRTQRPRDAVVAEEGSGHGDKGAAVTWVVDPLDGTTNYAHGFPHFCVSVGAVSNTGELLAGAVADVTRLETFLAGAGRGAWLSAQGGVPQRLSTSSCAALSQALLATGFPYDRAQHRDSNHAEHDALSMQTQGVRRPGAAALDLAWTAAGRLDGYWEAHLKPWDVAAGALLVREAGGLVTGFDGEPFVHGQHHVVTAGPALHGALLGAVQAVRRAQGFPPFPVRPV
jgi:myo-inositol-1(or 4)-monophosphatase